MAGHTKSIIKPLLNVMIIDILEIINDLGISFLKKQLIKCYRGQKVFLCIEEPEIGYKNINSSNLISNFVLQLNIEVHQF